MKKMLCLLLALVMALALCACGSSAQTGTTDEEALAEVQAAVDEVADDVAAALEGVTDDAAAIADSVRVDVTDDAAAGAAYVFLDEDLGTESYAIGFRLGDEELAETVSGAVMALVQNGTYAAIGENYPEIADYLCLTADDVDAAAIPEQGSGDPDYTFKHGFDLDYPPYSYLQDDGSVGGFDVELCQAVCEYLGWGYEAVPFNWDAKDMELNAGSCDCIWSGFTKEGREDAYTWGVTYSNNTQGILVAADSGIATLADLAGRSVGVQTATSAAEMLEDAQADLAATFAELRVYETYTIAFNDLKAGAIDAIAIDMTAGAFLIANEG